LKLKPCHPKISAGTLSRRTSKPTRTVMIIRSANRF